MGIESPNDGNAGLPPRMFVCGDVHGCLDELLDRLAALDFDHSRDRLYALGDLVDRGPKSAEIVRLLDEPWFASIMGNHEAMLLQAWNGKSTMHCAYGGGWFAVLSDDERAALVERIRRLPVAVTLISPSGRRIGLVHADIPGGDWNKFIQGPRTHEVQNYALWSRARVRALERGASLSPITNIDHVYFGHTPLAAPVRTANMSWIDTGCFKTGRLTIEELI